MDITTLRALVTLFSLIMFVSICWWTWSSKNKTNFDEAANLPFQEGESV